MKTLGEKIRGRMRKDRPMTTISIRIPEDLIDDLKEMAPMLGFSGYQPLIRSYVGEGMRRDEALLNEPEVRSLQESLKRHGLSEEAISEVVAETIRKRA
jgi:hypothetical protein